jgi:quinohemoprotein ethanol dehydrogenase
VNPGESWDYSAAMDIEFADLKIDGKVRKVLMQVPKNGFFYVIDRTNGQLISAEPIVKVNWASKIDLKTGRPVENPAARYPNGTTFTMWPSGNGGHNWYPMAYSPQTKLAYVPVLERAMTYADFELKDNHWQQLQPVGTIQSATINTLPEVDDPLNRTSRLEAWNPVTQKRVWFQQMASTEGGGVVATAGNLVFQGQPDGTFTAYAADTGKKLWTYETNAPVLAPPISYAVDGRQYLSVLTGISGHTALAGSDLRDYKIEYRSMQRRVLTFALGGTAELPPRVQPQPFIDDPAYKADAAQEHRGMALFQNCFVCHGFGAEPGGSAPDLRRSPIPLSAEAFRGVVKEGALLSAGMPVFPELSDAQLEDIRQYIRSRAAAARGETGKEAVKGKTHVSQ